MGLTPPGYKKEHPQRQLREGCTHSCSVGGRDTSAAGAAPCSERTTGRTNTDDKRRRARPRQAGPYGDVWRWTKSELARPITFLCSRRPSQPRCTVCLYHFTPLTSFFCQRTTGRRRDFKFKKRPPGKTNTSARSQIGPCRGRRPYVARLAGWRIQQSWCAAALPFRADVVDHSLDHQCCRSPHHGPVVAGRARKDTCPKSKNKTRKNKKRDAQE